MEFEIRLDKLKFHAFHGLFPQEKAVGNVFIVDVVIRFPYPEGGVYEDISKTISYADLFRIVEKEMNQPRDLLESVTESIREKIISQYPEVSAGKITICKSTPPIGKMNGSASVSLIF